MITLSYYILLSIFTALIDEVTWQEHMQRLFQYCTCIDIRTICACIGNIQPNVAPVCTRVLHCTQVRVARVINAPSH